MRKLMALALAIGLLIRVVRLDRLGLDDNEGYTVALAQRNMRSMAHLFQSEANGIAYALVLWPLVRISEAVAVIRLPALIAGVLAIVATYWVGTELLDRSSAALGALLLALSPLAVEWSGNARADGFALLFGTLSFGCLARAVRVGGYWWPLYVLSLVGAAYSNALTPLTLPVAQSLIVLRERRTRTRQWLASLAAVALLLAPLAVLLSVEQRHRNPLFALGPPSARSISRAARDYVAGEGAGSTASRALAYLLVAVGLMVVIAAWNRKFSWRPRSVELMRRPITAVAVWAVVPTVLLVLVSEVHPVWEGAKSSLSTLPAVCLLLGAALVSLPLRQGLAAAATVGALLTASIVTHLPGVPGYRSAGAWLEHSRRTADPLVVGKINILAALAYYTPALRMRDGLIPVEEWRDTPLPANVTGFRVPGMRYGHVPVGPPGHDELERLLQRTGRVFFVLEEISLDRQFLDKGPALVWARQHCRVTQRWFNLTVLEIEGCR